jgi:hypothetical protein
LIWGRDFPLGGNDIAPISAISARTPSQSASSRVLGWSGYQISLVNLCNQAKKSSEISEALKTGQAKLIVPDKSAWTVADANFPSDACKRIEKAKVKYQHVGVVFDKEIPGLKGMSKYFYIDEASVPLRDALRLKKEGFLLGPASR